MTDHPIVAGLDLSMACTGLAVNDSYGGIETFRVKSAGKKGATVDQTAARIALILRSIIEWLGQYRPLIDLAVIESPSFGSKGGAAHERGGIWWGVAANLSDWRIPIATVAPKTRAIYGVGHGNGTGVTGKREVRDATIARYPQVEIPDDNVADAVLLAAMGRRWLGKPIDGDLDEKFTRAIGSAKWPASS